MAIQQNDNDNDNKDGLEMKLKDFFTVLIQRIIQQLDPVPHRCLRAALQVRDASDVG